MFEDYAFSFSWPDFMTRFDRITWFALGMTGLGLLVAGYGLFHLIFSPQVTNSANPGEVLGSTTLLGNIYIDVSGAVEQPGLYQLTTGDRVSQALERAGGLSVEADTSFVAQQLNLARKLSDGEKLFVPFTGQLPSNLSKAGNDPNSREITAQGSGDLISINTASQKELEALPQVGEKRAADIIQNRPYTVVTELMDKGVVTEKIFNEIQSLIAL